MVLNVDRAVALAISIFVACLLVVFAVRSWILLAFAIFPILGTWLYVVDRDIVLAVSVFFTLTPVWIYLKWFGWPSVPMAGGELYVATFLKEGLLGTLFLYWLANAYRNDELRLRLTPTLFAFFALSAVGLLQGGLSRYPALLRPYVEMFILVGIPLFDLDLSRRDIDRLFAGIAHGGMIVAAVALYHALVDPHFLLTPDLIREPVYKTTGSLSAFLGMRLQSFTGNPNNLGGVMLVTSIVTFGLAFADEHEKSERERAWYLSIFVVATVVLMLSRSRDDIVFLGFGLLLFVVLQRRTMPLLLGAGAFAFGVLLNIDQIIFTFRILFEQGNPRFHVWVAGVRFFGFELIQGVGAVHNQFVESNPYDNSYFRILVQLGVGGLALFVVFNAKLLLTLARKLYHSGYDYASGTLLIALCVLLGGFFFSMHLFVFPFSIYYWTMCVLALRMSASDVCARPHAEPHRAD